MRPHGRRPVSARGLLSAPAALRFVLLVGAMSFFADFTYEGSRSMIGQYLAQFGLGALGIAAVSGLGELLGYALRLPSGRLADATRRYWPVAIFGYVLQMSVVPLLAWAASWPVAAALVVLERVGKATRNPPRDAMLAHAARDIGYGWAFGVHEALDQFGATFGPLLVALILALDHGRYRLAFAALALPAATTLSLLFIARREYPRPQDLAAAPPAVTGAGLPSVFGLYLAAVALVGAGFADFPLIAFRLEHSGAVPMGLVPVFYAVAMAVSGTGSLAVGRLYDRAGFGVLVPLTLLAAAYAPLVFLGGLWPALAGAVLWGVGMGVTESIIPAAVAPMVAADRRASAYGLFTAVYGSAWFLGSLVIGALFTRSPAAAALFCVAVQVAAAALLLWVKSRARAGAAA